MLSAQEIANYLVKNFDTIAASHPDNYQFSILAEIGKGYDGKKINGMVRTVSADPSPIPTGYVEAEYVFVVEMFVSGSSNYKYLGVNKIVNEFIKANQSSTVEFENGKGVMTFTMGVPKSYKIEYVLGEGVPLTFTVHVTYTENGVTSGDKHWLLDGVEIPFLSESVSVEREGISRKIYTEVYNKILLTGQTKFYTFRIPYESNTFKSLQTEILQAPAVNAAVHTLTYYDGQAFTKDKPYTAKVSIYRSASSNSTRPNAAAYDVTFTDVYDSDGKTISYKMALIDFPFDMQGDDTRYFNSLSEQILYFQNKAHESSAPFVDIEAPNLDGLYITKQVYRAPNATGLSQFDLVSKNYAVIQVFSFKEMRGQAFYYFIENATIGADGSVIVDLKMDTVQTYFFNPDITFSDCLIERAHLNRFAPVEGDSSKVKFVTDPASKIYNSEAGFNFPKRLVDRQKLKLKYLGSKAFPHNDVDEWLNENIAFWVYVFIDPTKNYSVNGATLTDEETQMGRNSYFNEYNSFAGATNCICYPIYKNPTFSGKNSRNIIKVSFYDNNNSEFIVAEKGEIFFANLNDAKSYYYSIKISCVAPYDIWYTEHNIDDNNNLVIRTIYNKDVPNLYPVVSGTVNGEPTVVCSGLKTSSDFGVFFGTSQQTYDLNDGTKLNLKTFDYSLPENSVILKSNIKKQQPPQLAYNPKLNSQNFKELTITSASGDTFSYDIQKLNDDSISFEYTEPLIPEITKYYMRVNGGSGLYADGTDENYTGLVGSTDNSLAYANDQYANFIANNKNFFMQSNMKLGIGAVKSAMGIAGQLASGNIAGAITSGVTAGIDLATAAIDRDMTIDNMKNAPDQLKNANGNVIFNMFCTDLGLYVEKYSALEGDLKTANDFMNLYGFTFSAVANVRDYVHIRKYHNYIKAQVQSINGNLSNVARQDLRQRFANGIRFWNSDVVDYSYENYELWLET